LPSATAEAEGGEKKEEDKMPVVYNDFNPLLLAQV
jgi:hypothetical protein